MPVVERPDGSRVHFEVSGSGYPVLLLAPGGVCSRIEAWEEGPFDPRGSLAGRFRVIAMDQRHAGRSTPAWKPFSYEDSVQDQLAVLDAVGARKVHIFAAGSGCIHAFRLVCEARERVSAVVCQSPLGVGKEGLGPFLGTFAETMRVARGFGMADVVEVATREPCFERERAGGPFAQRIRDDAVFRQQVLAMRVENYITQMIRFRDGIWPSAHPFFSVSEEWLRTWPTPMHILMEDKAPQADLVSLRLAELIPHASSVEPGWHVPATRAETIDGVLAFFAGATPKEG